MLTAINKDAPDGQMSGHLIPPATRAAGATW